MTVNSQSLSEIVKILAPGIETYRTEVTQMWVFTGPKIEARIAEESVIDRTPQEQVGLIQQTIEGMQTHAIHEFGLHEWADKQIKQAEDRARAAEQARIKGILSAYEQQLANLDKMEAAGYFAQAAREIAENRDR